MIIDSITFWSKVEKTPSCWNWISTLDGKGYGKFKRGGNWWSASRTAWTFGNGSIPSKKHVLHRCDNPACVNPEHLYLGSHQDNMRDRGKRGRSRGRFSKTFANGGEGK